MAIKPICFDCGNELKEPGGILLSSPNAQGLINEYHLCKECSEFIIDLLLKTSRRDNEKRKLMFEKKISKQGKFTGVANEN